MEMENYCFAYLASYLEVSQYKGGNGGKAGKRDTERSCLAYFAKYSEEVQACHSLARSPILHLRCPVVRVVKAALILLACM